MEAIAHIVRQLKKIKAVKVVFLFGSYARGTQKPISDIDLCVITKRNISDKTKGIIGSHSSPTINISLFWNMPPAVRYSALKDSKILYRSDKELWHDSVVSTMSEYLDFKHIITRAIARARL